MPYRRSTRRSYYRRRPAFRRTYRRRRVFGKKRTGSKIFWYKQFVNGSDNTSFTGNAQWAQTTTDQHLRINFALSDLPQASALTALYNEYKIWKVQVKFTPMTTQMSETITTPAVPMNVLATVIDYTGTAVLASYQQYEQYESFKYIGCQMQRSHVRTLRPKFLRNTLGTGLEEAKSGWLSTAVPTVPHAGLKVFLGASGNANVAQVYYVQMKYIVAFRSVK